MNSLWVETENDGHSAVVTLNRPEQMNPLDRHTVKDLLILFRQFDTEKKIRAVILTGAGKAFSAGGDLAGYQTLYRQPDAFRAFLNDFRDLCFLIENGPMVVIAAVNGWCLAGGIELALACDLIIAADSARIGDAHLNYGQLPGAGGSQRLPRAIGAQRAKWLIYRGHSIDGIEAERIGLAAMAVPSKQLLATARDTIAEMLGKSPAGLKGAKHLVNEGLKKPLADAVQFELDYVHNYATTHPDALEGLAAFAAKRKPRFTDGE